MNKSRLILSSLVGTIALGALSLSMSLAWYASGDRLSISAVDMTINSDTGVKVSTSKDLDTFKQELDLNSDEIEGEERFSLKPASSMYQDEWLTPEADTPLFYDSSFVDSFGANSKLELKDGFYQKKLYLLTDTNYYVGLDVKKSLFENDETANSLRARTFCASSENSELGLKENEVTEALNKLINCLRVSILVNDVTEEEMATRFFIINPTKQEDEKTYLGGRLDNDNDGYYDTYPDFDENNEVVEKEIVYGEVNDRSLISYQEPVDKLGEEERKEQAKRFFGNSFSGESKKSAYTFDEESSLANGLAFKEEGALSLDELDGIVIPCYQNQPREIVISIYLEGWDLDCINATMGASFNTKLSFKLLRGII